MANDVSDTVRNALAHAVRDAVKNMSDAPSKVAPKKSSPLSGMRGVAAGAGLAALAPLAKKTVDSVRSNGGMPSPSPAKAVRKVVSQTGDKVTSNLKDVADEKVKEAGGPGGMLKDAASGLLPGGGGDGGGGSKQNMPGVGKGRRMPVQQAIDVAVPLETAYNQWTQFETWPEFMHRVTRVTQDEDETVSFATKIWGKTKEFDADIITQRPDERIMWRVSQGITHTGVVTFHELAPRLTRIEINLDVDPGSLIEKAARGMRHVKRAVRADLHRFKAFIEMQEVETGAWRGRIEDGEVVEEHDPSYDSERDYSEVEDIQDLAPESAEAEADEDEEQDEEQQDEDERQDDQRQRTQRFKRQAERSRQRDSDSDSDSDSESDSGSESGRRSRTAAASRSSSSRSTTGARRNGSSGNGGKRSSSRSGSSSRSRSSSSGRRTSSSRS